MRLSDADGQLKSLAISKKVFHKHGVLILDLKQISMSSEKESRSRNMVFDIRDFFPLNFGQFLPL